MLAMMPRRLETKACKTCASSKRKCDRRIPQCLRCSRRNAHCIYPSSHPSRFVLLPEDEDSVTSITTDTVNSTSSTVSSAFISPKPTIDESSPPYTMFSGRSVPFSLDVDLPGLTDGYNSNFFREQLATSWFMSTEKWEIHQMPDHIRDAIEMPEYKRYIEQVQDWLKRWTETGSNHFIHPRLYTKRSPAPIQEAFTAAMCYAHKTPANEATVLEIVKSRAETLVKRYEKTYGPDSGPVDSNFPKEDILDGLAHVQALLVYQIIGLYDGDIRLRHLAEKRIPILYCWMNQLIRQASQCICIGSWMILDRHHQHIAPLTTSTANVAQWQNLLWYSWIMAESIRRTWMLCSGVQGIYLITRDGVEAVCQGSITFTSRKGVWEAESAAEWESLCARKSVGMIQMNEVDKLFTEMEPQEVDEFAKLILEINFGHDRLKSWR